MPNRYAILEEPGGWLWVISPFRPPRDGETPETHLANVVARHQRAARNGHELKWVGTVGREDLPPEVFSIQWRWRNGRVTVDMPLARAHKMTLIRRERNARLLATDADFIRANERNSPDLDAIKQKRQALRDIPQTVNLDAIQTPEELEAFEPAWPE